MLMSTSQPSQQPPPGTRVGVLSILRLLCFPRCGHASGQSAAKTPTRAHCRGSTIRDPPLGACRRTAPRPWRARGLSVWTPAQVGIRARGRKPTSARGRGTPPGRPWSAAAGRPTMPPGASG